MLINKKSAFVLFGLFLLNACGFESGENIQSVSEELNTSQPLIATDAHTVCAVRAVDPEHVEDQRLYCWANTDKCQVGTCQTLDPFDVEPPYAGPNPSPSVGSDIVKLTAFYQGFCTINGTTQGTRKTKCWGDNSFGQIGLDPVTTPIAYTPHQMFGTNSVAVQGGAGTNHVCALVAESPISSNASVRCWGRNDNGQLGSGATSAYSYTPVVSLIASSWVEVAVDGTTSCARKASGEVRCWGAHHGNSTPAGIQLVPTVVSGLSSGVTSLAGGDSHFCVVQNGTTKCWGNNTYGELGNNSVIASKTPVIVSLPLNTNAGKVWAGQGMSCGMKATTGGIYCWGDNSHGQLGDGTTIERHIPTGISGMSSPSWMSLGRDGVVAHKAGTYYGWGDNTESQLYVLPLGTPAYSATPVAFTLPPP